MFNAAFTNVNVNFDDHFLLKNINWRINDSQHWVITGQNGSGKSALAASLTGIGEIESGTILGLPENIAVVSFEAQAALIEAERRKDDADILDVISEGTTVEEILNDGCALPDAQKKLITAFGFESLLTRSFRKLSTGETRKVLLIKALTSNADLLILDEPFEGLDKEADALLHELLTDYSRTTPIIMVLNRFDEIPEFVSHIAYVEQGTLQHSITRSDENAVNEIKQLLHLKTSELNIPPPPVSDTGITIKPGSPLVTIRNGKIAYGDTTIFNNLNWQINAGEHWQVSGPNGSGKTCLLNLITGDHPQCYVNDITIFDMKRGNGETIWDIKQHIGYVSSALQWEYKVSVSVRNAIISGLFDSIGIYQQYSDEQRDIADDWLALLGMQTMANKPFNQLSFGDQRLVLIARAMVKHPPLLILDEPCLGLDDVNRHMVLALIEKICTNSITTVLYVNHRLEDKIKGISNHLSLGDNQSVTIN